MTIPYVRGSDTSRAAAESMVENRLNELQRHVLAFLRSRGARGASDEEMQEALGMAASTQRPRRVELMRKGLVVASGTTSMTRSGRQAEVWLAAEPGSVVDASDDTRAPTKAQIAKAVAAMRAAWRAGVAMDDDVIAVMRWLAKKSA